MHIVILLVLVSLGRKVIMRWWLVLALVALGSGPCGSWFWPARLLVLALGALVRACVVYGFSLCGCGYDPGGSLRRTWVMVEAWKEVLCMA